VFKGEDFYGNKYYEAPRGERGKYLKTHRWMEPAPSADLSDEEFSKLPWKEQARIVEDRQDVALREVPPEWESWMRGRRTQTPSLQEQARSARIALRAKGLFPEKANDDSASSTAATSTGKSAEEVRKDSVTGLSFPMYEDLEIQAGEELSSEEKQRRVQYAMDESRRAAIDDDSEFVPPGAKK